MLYAWTHAILAGCRNHYERKGFRMRTKQVFAHGRPYIVCELRHTKIGYFQRMVSVACRNQFPHLAHGGGGGGAYNCPLSAHCHINFHRTIHKSKRKWEERFIRFANQATPKYFVFTNPTKIHKKKKKQQLQSSDRDGLDPGALPSPLRTIEAIVVVVVQVIILHCAAAICSSSLVTAGRSYNRPPPLQLDLVEGELVWEREGSGVE